MSKIYQSADVETVFDAYESLKQAARAQGLNTWMFNLVDATIASARKNATSDDLTAIVRVQLTPAQVRETIEKSGVGDSFTAKTEDVAARVVTSRKTIFRWIEGGTTRHSASVGLLCQLAYEHKVIERPDDDGGVMII